MFGQMSAHRTYEHIVEGLCKKKNALVNLVFLTTCLFLVHTLSYFVHHNQIFMVGSNM